MSPTPPIPTEITRPEWNSALSSSKRRETRKPDGTVRQRAGSLTYLYVRTHNRIAVKLSDTCKAPTATWEWDPITGMTGRHMITVHPRCPEAFFLPTKNHSKRRIDLVKSVIAHEVCHGLYTSRSTTFAAECRAAKIPFRLLNLMEDCRIEHKYVAERGKEFRFRWRLFDDNMAAPKSSISSPTTWLFTMKTREPYLFKSGSAVMAPFMWGGPTYIHHPKTSYAHPLSHFAGSSQTAKGCLGSFYDAIIKAATTEALLPIARYWVELFGEEADSSLPSIIIDTVPSSIGGEESEGGPSGSESASRGVDHSAVEASSGRTTRSVIEPDKVMHHNTDKWTHQPPRSGFIPLLQYCQPA